MDREILHSGTHGTCSWEINNEGLLKIYPTNGEYGMLASQVDLLSYTSPWEKFHEEIQKVIVEQGVATNKDATHLFYNLKNCKEMDLSGLDTSKTERMYGVFYGCKSLVSLDLSNFDTSKVRDMNSMFDGCSNLRDLNVSSFDTSSVWTMQNMFLGCMELKNLDISNFNMENVKYRSGMFADNHELPNSKTLATEQAKFEKAWKPPKSKEQGKSKTHDDINR